MSMNATLNGRAYHVGEEIDGDHVQLEDVETGRVIVVSYGDYSLNIDCTDDEYAACENVRPASPEARWLQQGREALAELDAIIAANAAREPTVADLEQAFDVPDAAGDESRLPHDHATRTGGVDAEPEPERFTCACGWTGQLSRSSINCPVCFRRLREPIGGAK